MLSETSLLSSITQTSLTFPSPSTVWNLNMSMSKQQYNTLVFKLMRYFLCKTADVLKELLRFFPSLVMTTDITNSTALHTAAAQGHTEVVNLLLETDSNLAKIARNNGKSVLHTAARMGHLEVVKALLDKDPSIGFKTDRKGQTALHMAIKGQNVEIVRELIKPDPSLLSVEDNKGNTALHIATRKGRNQVGVNAVVV